MSTLTPVFPVLDEPLRSRIADALAKHIALCMLDQMCGRDLGVPDENGRESAPGGASPHSFEHKSNMSKE